jgi:protein arginine kinase activator
VLCQECKMQPATVHLTKIVNNNKTEFYLCEECARKKGQFNISIPFSINDLLAGFIGMDNPSVSVQKEEMRQCKSCGMRFEQFRKNGRLGCQDCYKYFSDDLLPILRRIHGGTKHNGKVPKRAGVELRITRQIQQLKTQLQKAVETENFEEAARLRDRIKELEKQTGQK